MKLLCGITLLGLAAVLTKTSFAQLPTAAPESAELANKLNRTGAKGAEKNRIPGPHVSQEEKNKQDLFEGDVHLTAAQKKELQARIKDEEKGKKPGSKQKRKYLRLAKKWPNGIVYYEPLRYGYFRYNRAYKRTIYAAMRHIQTQTCIRFRARRWGPRVRFVSGSECSSHLGMTLRGGVHRITLGPRCNTMGVVVHEILHALGFLHEQSRPDRDRYVRIIWRNIQWHQRNNFKKYSRGQAYTLNIPYDVSSIMHYGSKDFAVRRGLRTIIPRNRRYLSVIGQRNGLSRYDSLAIRRLYCRRSRGGRGGGRRRGGRRRGGRRRGGRRGRGRCVNRSRSCYLKRRLCRWRTLYRYMARNCRRTCNMCRRG